MKNLLRSCAAVALALSGVLIALSAPASAAAKTKSVTCYKLVHNKVQSHKFKNAKGVCGKGWSKHKPKPTQAIGSLQGSNKSGDIDLVVPSSESLAINGSSFDAPMIGATTSGSTAYTAGGKVTFSSYPAAGSGTGRTAITSGSVDIGFSDTPMTPGAATLPGGVTESNYVQVPYILGGAVIGYNLGGSLNNIKLTSNEIAKIFDGQITQWSDPAIINTNGGASSPTGKSLQALYTSHAASDNIKVIYRNASSGTTYAFTDYLHASGGSPHTPSGNVMEGTGNAWHAPNILGAANNAAMATDINANPGAIGYVEYSYLLIPGNAAIQTASMQDREGVWLQPTLANIAAAGAAAGTNITPDNFSIVNQGGKNVWPLATYSWAIIPKNETNAGKGEAVVKYLDWETHYAQSALAKAEGYVPLPTAVAAYARQQLLQVTSGGNVLLTMKS
ncbi:MAG TPA: substrate-binding domain-containing protein [Acidimicrobiales bacterium]